MIINYQTNPSHAHLYVIIDLSTGETPPLPIFYADDEAGIYRYYLKNERGDYLSDTDGKPAWAEQRGSFKLVPKDPEEVERLRALAAKYRERTTTSKDD